MLLDDRLLDRVQGEAKASERLRMNFNLHDSLDAKAQRLLNALEPGTILPIHRHPHTAETYILVRGRIDVMFYDDEIIDTPRLKVPHPLLHLREFALEPLCEIMAEYRHPQMGKTLKDIYEELKGDAAQKI
jgi:hypothetical protein